MEKKRIWRVPGIWSRKFFDPNELEKQILSISAFEQNGWRIKWFWKPELSDDDNELPKWFKQQRSDNVPGSGPILMITFVLPKY
jgi:hypothetical protein